MNKKYRICQQEDFRYYVQVKKWWGWANVVTVYGTMDGNYHELKTFVREHEAEEWIDEDIAMEQIARNKIPPQPPREYP